MQMKKLLFRSSKPQTPAPADGSGDKADSKVAVKKKKEKKPKPVNLLNSPAFSPAPYPSNIPQLARASDAEALATALAAEVYADNADCGIPTLLKNPPAQVDLTKAPPNLRRGSVLKSPTRLNSITSEEEGEQSSLASPPLSARSNSVTSQTRHRVHFDVSEKIILEAQWYSHQQRFTITSGNFLHFERPPTHNYRFSTTAESIHTKGTLLQLVTSASSEDEKNTWDSTTGLPLYAARYHNPNVTNSDRTIYWEAEVRSLGFSKFSSVDHTNSSGSPVSPTSKSTTSPPGSPKPTAATPASPQMTATSPGSPKVAAAGEETLADLGLSRSISHTHTLPARMSGAAIAIGFVVKSVTPDTVPFIRRHSSLRPHDEFPFPYSTTGDGIFWSSENGGTIFIDGHPTRHTLKADVGDTIGIGITFKLDPAKKTPSNGTTPVPTPPTTPPLIPRKESKEMFRRKSTANCGKDTDAPYADPKDLKNVDVEVFFVVNGEKKLSISHPDLDAKTPLDIGIPEYLLGTNDVFPCICVQGSGIECKTRIGQAVNWRGEGGSVEPLPSIAAEENGETPPVKAEVKEVAKEKETPKKSERWWSHLRHHSLGGS